MLEHDDCLPFEMSVGLGVGGSLGALQWASSKASSQASGCWADWALFLFLASLVFISLGKFFFLSLALETVAAIRW